MSNLFDLTKIYLKQIFSRYLYGEKAKRRGLLKTILLLIFIVAVIEYSISNLIYTTAEQLNKVNLSQFIIVYGLIVSALFSIFIMAYEMPAHFYNAKDYENLASLPINTWVVVSAKFLSGFLTALLYSLLFTLPTFVIYFVFNSITFGGVVYAILSLIFIPMFVMFVSCIIGFIINIITSKMKNKTVVNTIFMFVFLAGIFALSFAGGSGDGALMFSNGQVPLTIKILTPYIYFIFNAIYLNSFLYFVFFVLVNLAYLVLAIFVVTLTYKKINSNMLISKVKISKKPISFNTESVPKTLLKKESKSFFWYRKCIKRSDYQRASPYFRRNLLSRFNGKIDSNNLGRNWKRRRSGNTNPNDSVSIDWKEKWNIIRNADWSNFLRRTRNKKRKCFGGNLWRLFQ